MPDDEQAIRDLVATWIRASSAGDLDTVLSLMADDVLFMVPGQEPFGKETFAARSRQMKDYRVAAKSDIQEIQLMGDWAYLRNFMAVSMTGPDGAKVMECSGHVLSILRKTADGRWLLARDGNMLAG